jgi:hypothetical protein
MSESHLHVDYGDHLHESALVEGNIGPVVDFDYAALENWDEPSANKDDPVTFGEMSSAFCVILNWICRSPHPNVVASRALDLEFWLAPMN